MDSMKLVCLLSTLTIIIQGTIHIPIGEAQSDGNTTFVLVHGFGFGAWAWFNVMSYLKEHGYGAVAIDLAAAGIDPSDANKVATLEQLGKPVFDYVSNFSGPEKLTLVGHSFGGFIISMVMEANPEKVSRAVFVAAVMPVDGDNYTSTIPPSIPVTNNDSILVFGDPASPLIPTSGYLKRDKVQEKLLNESPYEVSETWDLLSSSSSSSSSTTIYIINENASLSTWANERRERGHGTKARFSRSGHVWSVTEGA